MLRGMADEWVPTTIAGSFRRHLGAATDERGAFRELWRNSWTAGLLTAPFVQANLSRSAAGVLRGMHFHLRQTDLWVVLRGQALVALVDLRPMLGQRKAAPPVAQLAMTEGDCLVIPPVVAHGFWAETELELLYMVSHEYDGRDEHGFAWNDTQAGLVWPPETPIVSHRDATAASLAQVVAELSRTAD